MYILCLLVTVCACIIGKICGMGGGVIIKPVLDALNIASPAQINFLSGCTVIGMSGWSVGKSMLKEKSQIDLKVSTPLAVGAAVGGILGKSFYTMAAGMFSNPDRAGGIQAAILFVLTAGTLGYTVKKAAITSRRMTRPAACVIIGLGLGIMGSFLGIGGGPFNMAVFYFFFSMETKKAALNSLYVIMVSQLAGLLNQVITGSIPQISVPLLSAMILCGIAGSEIGNIANGRLDETQATRLFEAAMLLVMGICIYNVCRFLG